jgi:hypothetical protein
VLEHREGNHELFGGYPTEPVADILDQVVARLLHNRVRVIGVADEVHVWQLVERLSESADLGVLETIPEVRPRHLDSRLEPPRTVGEVIAVVMAHLQRRAGVNARFSGSSCTASIKFDTWCRHHPPVASRKFAVVPRFGSPAGYRSFWNTKSHR